MGKQSTLPQYHVLDFFYDDEDGCALTVRVNHAQFHIIVDPNQLGPISSHGKDPRDEYDRLLNLLKTAEDEDGGKEGPTQGGTVQSNSDSGIDVHSNPDNDSESSNDPHEQLYQWIMLSMVDAVKADAPDSNRPQGQTVHDFYHCPTFFYQLETKSGKLQVKKEKDDDSLKSRMKALLPDLPLPKYIRDLNIPVYSANKLLVQADSVSPEPIHPTLVTLDGERYFLKLVDMNQWQPTKREIQIMKQIERKGLHEQIRMPLVRGLVRFGEKGNGSILGFLMDPIDDPQPLTYLLDTEVPQRKRERWAEECKRMVDVLHEHGFVWGDAKGDNFMVDKHDNLWMIDFGGSYTEGWIDPELRETEAGDDMGTQKVVNALHDPEANTYGPHEPITRTTLSDTSPRRAKRGHAEVEQSKSNDDDEVERSTKQAKK